MIFDTHAHYDDEQFDEDREELLQSLAEGGVELVVNASASIETTRKTLELIKKYPFLYGAVGVHPDETKELNEESFSWLKEMTKQPKVVAVGEIGLDYYWDETEREVQKYWFRRQLELAKEAKLPIIVHSREAAKDTYDIMHEAKAEDIGGVIHCFSYSLEMAKNFLKMGYYLGIGGVVTFKNAKKLKEVVEYTPLDRIVLETDCPYLAPEPNRGKRNSSLNLVYVAKEIANIKKVEYDEVVAVTTKNAKNMYRL